MTIQQIQYLITTAKYGSITQAAESLFVSQSSISKSIRALEDELGMTILIRNYAGISFTAEGLNFLRDCYNLMAQYDRMQQTYTHKKGNAAEFGVSSQHYIFVLAAISRLVGLYESDCFHVTLRETKTTEIVQDVFTRRSNLGFIYYYDMNRDMITRELERFNLDFHPFCEAQPHVYLSEHHPLAAAAELTLEELEEYPYVYYDFGVDHIDFAEEVLAPSHTERSVAVLDRHSLFTVIQHTNSYCLGSGSLMHGFTPEGILSIPVHPGPGMNFNTRMTIGWIAPYGQILSPLEEEFLSICRSYIDAGEEALRIRLL